LNQTDDKLTAHLARSTALVIDQYKEAVEEPAKSALSQ